MWTQIVVAVVVADRGPSREEAYILLGIIGEVRVGHIAAPGDGDTADRAQRAVASGRWER